VPIGDAAMAADHGAEKQRDQHPTDKLKLEHDGFFPLNTHWIAWLAAAVQNLSKLPAA